MEISEKTKKILIYGGGAASIVALYLYVKNKGSAQAQAGFRVPSGGSGGGSSGAGGGAADPSEAARINAATQLAIAQGNQGLAYANIQSQKDVAQAQVAGAVRVAQINASASNTKAAFGALGSPAGAALGGTAVKAGTDIFKATIDAFKQLFGIGKSPTGTLAKETEAQALAGAALEKSYSTPGSSFLNPYIYSKTGNILDADNPNADYFMGSIGSGDSSYFGIGEGDPGFIGPSAYNVPVPDEFVGPYDTGFEGPPAPPPDGGYGEGGA